MFIDAFIIQDHPGQITYNDGLHNSHITANHLDAIPFGQVRGTTYEGSMLPSVMVELTIIQAAFSSIKSFDGTKSKFEA